MKLWIIGADGFLGSILNQSVHAAIATGRSQVDIGDLVALRSFAQKNPGITHIVNCAAFSLVDLAEERREEAFKANAAGPEHLAILASEIGARILHISTDYVFPGNLRRPLKEDDPTGPCNYYGFTKLEGEQRLLKINPSACVLRTSWIFGHGGKNFAAKLLQLFLKEEEVRLTNDHWNCPTFVRDLAQVILQMLNASGIFHFANSEVTTKYEFGLAMRQEAASVGCSIATQRIIPVPGSVFLAPASRPMYSALDSSKIETYLGVPVRPWREALRDHLREQHGTPP